MTLMRGIDFLLAGGSVDLHFLYYILILFCIFTMDLDMIIYCLNKFLKLFSLEMVKKNEAVHFLIVN